MTSTEPIGKRYINLISHVKDSNFTKNLEALFSPSIKKTINSKLICTNRNQLIMQMQDVEKTYGTNKVNLLELIIGNDHNLNIIRFEITFKDNTTDSVITILKCNNEGLIEEINEVFGEKETYQWPH